MKSLWGKDSLVSKTFASEVENLISIPLSDTDFSWEGIFSLPTYLQ